MMQNSSLDRFSRDRLLLAADRKDAIEWLLMECVIATANIEIHESVLGKPKYPGYSRLDEESCPYWRVQRYGLYASRRLGEHLSGSDVDITQNSLWKLVCGAYQNQCLECRERGRKVTFDDPTFAQLFLVFCRGNLLEANGIRFIPGEDSEGTDDYGQPAWYTEWTAISASEESTLHDGRMSLCFWAFELLYSRKPTATELNDAEKSLPPSFRFLLEDWVGAYDD